MHVPQIGWYNPPELQFDESPSSTLVTRNQTTTGEVLAQDAREKLALAAIYTSPQHIPPSPAEPEETPDLNADGSVPIIPLDDIEMMPVDTLPLSSSSPAAIPPPSHASSVTAPPALHPNLMTPANLNAAAAAIAAMQQAPAQQSQYANTPLPASPPVAPRAHYYDQQYNAAQPASVGSFGQPQVINQNVNEMLQKNPRFVLTFFDKQHPLMAFFLYIKHPGKLESAPISCRK